MKQINTFICSVLFVIAGALSIGFTNDRDGPAIFPGNATMHANTTPGTLQNGGLPLDLQLDLNKRAQVDTVYRDTGHVDTVYKYKIKIRKVVVPKVVEKYDTLSVPIFYIATPLEHEVESTEIRVINNVHINNLPETNQTDSIIYND